LAIGPFWNYLLLQLKRQGFNRAVLSVGQKQHVIREHFEESAFGLRLSYSLEPVPLGTGGGLRQSVAQIATESFLALNGDSYTNVDLISSFRRTGIAEPTLPWQ